MKFPISNAVYWLYDDSCVAPETDGYVGFTHDIRRRMPGHRSGKRFPADFKVLILFYGTRDECAAKERQYRPRPNIGWNVSSGGCGGHIAAEATRLLQSAQRRGRKQSPETIAKRIAHQIGRPLSTDHRARMSAAMRGKRKSEEHRAKLSAANKGKRLSPETCAKLTAAKLGGTLTAEHKQHVSDAIRLWHERRRSRASNGGT